MGQEKSMPGLSTTRRDFLQGVGGLTLTIGGSGLISACNREATGQDISATLTPNIWVTIGTNDVITIQYAGAEMGQGTMTSLPLVLAEELDADWRKVRVETVAIHDPAYGNRYFANLLYTAGSTALEAYFDTMRHAGAQARRLLIDAAAQKWGVAASELHTEPGVVVHGLSGGRMRYGEIATFAQVPESLPQIDEADFKPRSSHRYLGTDIQRLDVPSKVNGSAEYGIDVQIPGMLYASILRAPVEGEEPLEVDDSAARQIEGVAAIVQLPHGVAVVGKTIEATIWGKAALQVAWSEVSRLRHANLETDLADYLARAKDLSVETSPYWRNDGDVDTAIDDAAQIVEATYVSDPAYHAQMEPMNATARVSEDGKSAEIWVSTQTQSLSILGAAQALQTTPDKITLHPMLIGGGYGRRSFFRQKYIDDALFVSRAVRKPVKVIWSREDDIKNGAFRPAAAQYLRAGLDEAGRLTAWHHRVATPSVIEYMNPARWEAAAGRDVISMHGAENSRYDIPNVRVEHVMVQRRSRICAWRGVATSYTKFASESFIDEVALARGDDPLQFRLELCRDDPRARAVLETVAEMAEWTRPRQGTALGLALTGYRASISAGIAEASVDERTGAIKVHKFWMAADPGHVVAPRNTEAQLEGNIVFGLSSALNERITIDRGIVQQSNFHDYPVMRMSEVPEIEVKAISTDHPPSGVGELGLASVGAALANAVFRSTGGRVRQLPLTPDRVMAAING